MKYIGIEIAKSTFVAAYPGDAGYKTITYQNDLKGIKKFISTLDKDKHHTLQEATGNYGILLLYMLIKQGFKASLINPKQSKHFARMMLCVTKTDHIDAKLIALYGEKMQPEVYKMPSELLIELNQKRLLLRQYKKQQTALMNIKHSLGVLPKVDPLSTKSLKTIMLALQKQICALEKDIIQISQREYQTQMDLISSIKGIGPSLASAIITATSGFSCFQTAKQFSKYLGIAPSYAQSGSSLKTTGHINRQGDVQLRSMFYVASWSAIRFNKSCKELYERLKQRGKASKVALMAVINKMIRQVFAVIKHNTSYMDGFVSPAPDCKKAIKC